MHTTITFAVLQIHHISSSSSHFSHVILSSGWCSLSKDKPINEQINKNLNNGGIKLQNVLQNRKDLLFVWQWR
jgi:hypothetical protein